MIRRKEPKGRKKRFYSVLWIIEIYLFGTLLLFILGPIKWHVQNWTKLIVYVSACYLAVAVGYHASLKKYLRRNKNEINIAILDQDAILTYRLRRMFWISVVFAIFSSLAYMIIIQGGINISGAITGDIGEKYFDALTRAREGISSSIIQFLTLFSFLSYFFLPIGIWYWEKMKMAMKTAMILGIIFNIVYWANQGTSKGIGDVVLCFATVLYLKAFRSGKKKNTWNYYRIGIVGILIIFILFFSMIQYQRMRVGIEFPHPINLQSTLQEYGIINGNSVLWKIMGPSMGLGIGTFIIYITQGYYGLSGCLDLPFEWTYGAGFSMAIMGYADQYFGMSRIWEKHYLYRNDIATGWSSRTNWSTAFPWFASDITFIGVIILMILFGKMIAYAVRKVLWENDMVALTICWNMAIMIVYFPSNNQIFQSRTSLWGTCALWFFFFLNMKKKKNILHIPEYKTKY